MRSAWSPRELVVPVGDHDEARRRRDPPTEHPHHVQRALVRPVRVLHHDDEGLAGCGVFQESGRDVVGGAPRGQAFRRCPHPRSRLSRGTARAAGASRAHRTSQIDARFRRQLVAEAAPRAPSSRPRPHRRRTRATRDPAPPRGRRVRWRAWSRSTRTTCRSRIDNRHPSDPYARRQLPQPMSIVPAPDGDTIGASERRSVEMAIVEANPNLGAQIVADAKEHVLYSWSVQTRSTRLRSPEPRAATSGTTTASATSISPRSSSTSTSATSTRRSSRRSRIRPTSSARSARRWRTSRARGSAGCSRR